MRNLLKLISTTGLAMALATSSDARPFSGRIGFSLGGLAPLVASGTGSGDSPGTISILTASWAQTGPVLIGLGPAAPPISALNIRLTAPGPCAALPGSCALDGTANGLVAGAPFLVVPLSALGAGGRQSFGPYGSYIDAQPWQTGVVPITVNGVTLITITPDFAYTPIKTTGYDNRDSAGVGRVKLVAPAGLMSTLGGQIPLFVSMTLNFVVPEPETLLLAGLGVAGLALVGHKRMRR